MTDVSQNNGTPFSDRFHGSERQNFAVWTGFYWTDHQHFALCGARALGCSA